LVSSVVSLTRASVAEMACMFGSNGGHCLESGAFCK
jgi:hypothetical protein